MFPRKSATPFGLLRCSTAVAAIGLTHRELRLSFTPTEAGYPGQAVATTLRAVERLANPRLHAARARAPNGEISARRMMARAGPVDRIILVLVATLPALANWDPSCFTIGNTTHFWGAGDTATTVGAGYGAIGLTWRIFKNDLPSVRSVPVDGLHPRFCSLGVAAKGCTQLERFAERS